MFQKIARLIDHVKPVDVVYAHCDIPCGIYNPDDALQAAKTMRKMVQKIAALPKDDVNNRTRMIMVKEDHGKKCKHELFTLWSDYFKEEHLEKLPDLHEKIWHATKLVSKVKQSLDEKLADELVVAVEEIAAMFKKVEGAPKKE